MRLAYLVLMHGKPEQAARLIGRLQNPTSTFIVHVDAKAPQSVFDYMQKWSAPYKNVHLTKRHRCYWGGFGIVAATIECIRSALLYDPAFDYAFLLSGQDYPIKPLSHITAYLRRHRKQFIESFRLDRPNRWTDAGHAYQAMNRISWYTVAVRSHFIRVPVKRVLPDGLSPFGGSQWWCLSRQCLKYVDEVVRARPDIVRYFRRTFVPDELFFQTIMSNSPFGGQATGDDLRYIDFVRPNPHYPRTFGVEDFDRILASPKLFARKFDLSRDEEILDRIDREILIEANAADAGILACSA